MESRQIYRLDDSVIAQIVRILQIGLLTGTDVSDHMRLLVLEPKRDRAGHLALTPEYLEQDGKNIESLFDRLEDLMDKEEEEKN